MPKKTTTKKTKKSKSKKITLMQTIFNYFTKSNDFENVKYEDCLKLAKATKKDTKFNKNHFSWYKNKFRELDLN